MPFEAQRGQRVDLLGALLHVVLAEGTLARRGGLAHTVGRPGLADGQQPYFGGITPGRLGGTRDAHDKVLEAGGKP